MTAATAPVITVGRVHVAVAPIGDPPPVRDTPADLPPWRLREHRASRALLRRLLAEVVGADAARGPIAAEPGGRPWLPERPRVGVSVSHSGEWVAAAVGLGVDVGVDVQEPQPTPATLLRRCCRPAARAVLERLPHDERDVEFAWLWTAQEACVKATGEGLAGRPWTVPVDVGQRTGTWRGVRWTALRAHGPGGDVTDLAPVPVSCAYREAVT